MYHLNRINLGSNFWGKVDSWDLNPHFFKPFIISHLFLIYFRQCWVSIAVGASHGGGFPCCGARSPGRAGSVVVAHGLSCSTACGIFPDPGSNLCLLHWQVDSLPLSHQGRSHYQILILKSSKLRTHLTDSVCCHQYFVAQKGMNQLILTYKGSCSRNTCFCLTQSSTPLPPLEGESL